LSIMEYSALVRKRRGFLAQAHPYRGDIWVECPYPVEPELLDSVEAFNATMPSEVNAKAMDFARKHRLPAQAGSDSHHADQPFFSGVYLEKRAKSIQEIYEAIKAGKAELKLP